MKQRSFNERLRVRHRGYLHSKVTIARSTRLSPRMKLAAMLGTKAVIEKDKAV